MQLVCIESSDPLREDQMLTAGVDQLLSGISGGRQSCRFIGRIPLRGGADVDGVSIDPAP